MPAVHPVLYFDLGSPYAYLAMERAPSVLRREPQMEPVLLGAIFARRGFGSWAQTPARNGRMAEIEARAERYGLASLRWPPSWPANGLTAMRCATWAKQQGAPDAYARAVFRREFERGEDISDMAVLLECAREAGLDADAMARELELAPVREALREATQAAWDAGVRGVPSLKVRESIFYGDDQLELAAAALDA
ncbi:MAG: oxidoreductase [Solirubrobacterales bacterium]|nr:oxidoreductase [Solirubrobacterales bacterium]